MTKQQKLRADELLGLAVQAQNEYWKRVRDLEVAIRRNIDESQDLSRTTLDELMKGETW
jgi:hypothetical protein